MTGFENLVNVSEISWFVGHDLLDDILVTLKFVTHTGALLKGFIKKTVK